MIECDHKCLRLFATFNFFLRKNPESVSKTCRGFRKCPRGIELGFYKTAIGLSTLSKTCTLFRFTVLHILFSILASESCNHLLPLCCYCGWKIRSLNKSFFLQSIKKNLFFLNVRSCSGNPLQKEFGSRNEYDPTYQHNSTNYRGIHVGYSNDRVTTSFLLL